MSRTEEAYPSKSSTTAALFEGFDLYPPQPTYTVSRSANFRRQPGQPPSPPTASRVCSQPSPCRSRLRCSNSTRVRLGPSQVNNTSISLVFVESVSTCHCGLISQLIITRRG